MLPAFPLAPKKFRENVPLPDKGRLLSVPPFTPYNTSEFADLPPSSPPTLGNAMSRFLAVALALNAWAMLHAQEPGLDHTMYRMSIPGGFAVTPDLAGLVVSQPESVELVYFNTLTEKETKRVEMPFPPGALCLRERVLFAAGKGAGVVYQLDLGTAKVVRE